MNIDPDLNDDFHFSSLLQQHFQQQRDEIVVLRARVIALEQNVEGRLTSLESANADKL